MTPRRTSTDRRPSTTKRSVSAFFADIIGHQTGPPASRLVDLCYTMKKCLDGGLDVETGNDDAHEQNEQQCYDEIGNDFKGLARHGAVLVKPVDAAAIVLVST